MLNARFYRSYTSFDIEPRAKALDHLVVRLSLLITSQMYSLFLGYRCLPRSETVHYQYMSLQEIRGRSILLTMMLFKNVMPKLQLRLQRNAKVPLNVLVRRPGHPFFLPLPLVKNRFKTNELPLTLPGSDIATASI